MNWQVLATISAPIIALFTGAALNRRIERRPKLVSFMSHASAVPIQSPNGQQFIIHTHTVVIRNAGGASANNARLNHAVLPPNFSVYPSIEYNVVQLPGGGADIVFPKLVPGEQVTVTYIYEPPLFASQVNTNAKSDEGFAKIVTVLWSPQLPTWQRRLSISLVTIGIIAVLYLVVELGIQLWARVVAP